MSRAANYSGKLSDELERFRRGRPVVLIAIVAAIVMVVLPSLEAKANCQDLLDNNVYRCRVKVDDEDDRFTDCFHFTSPGERSEDFDLSLDLFPGILGCDCRATGTFPLPNFAAANSFHCVSTFDSISGLSFVGAVRQRGRVIVGQAVNEDGDSFFFRCNRAPRCATPVTPLGAPAASWQGAQ